MTRKRLHELIRESSQRLIEKKLDDLEKKIVDITKCPPEKINDLKKTIKVFRVLYKRKWLACNMKLLFYLLDQFQEARKVALVRISGNQVTEQSVAKQCNLERM